MSLALTLLLAVPASSMTGTDPLGIKALAGPSGFVRLQVDGPAGASVVVAERSGAAMNDLRRLTLAGAPVVLDRVAAWSCVRRDRMFVASMTLGDGSQVERTVKVRTPACSTRLAVRLLTSAKPGQLVAVRLRDRWAGGGLGIKLCVTPPGGVSTCRSEKLPSDSRPVTLRFRARRIGSWKVRAVSSVGQKIERPVAVRPRRGLLRLLTIGDSQMQLLDEFLAGSLRLRGTRLRQRSDARVSTGLSNSSFFNWPPHARRLTRAFRPDVSVVFLGANDGFPLPTQRRRLVACCGLTWVRAYARRVNNMMLSMLRGGQGRVYWVLLPVARDRQVARYFRAVNAGIRLAAARHRGEVRVIDSNATFAPDGAYRTTIVDRGRSVTVRDPDGYHLSVAGTRIAARVVADALREDGVVTRHTR